MDLPLSRPRLSLAIAAVLVCIGPSAGAGDLASGGSYKNQDHSNENHCCGDLSNALLKGVDFSNTDLRGSNLSGADLKNADLNGALLDGSNLTDAILKNANLVGASYDDATLWPTGFDPQAAGARYTPTADSTTSSEPVPAAPATEVPAADGAARAVLATLLLAGARVTRVGR